MNPPQLSLRVMSGDVNTENVDGETALGVAAFGGHAAVVQHMLHTPGIALEKPCRMKASNSPSTCLTPLVGTTRQPTTSCTAGSSIQSWHSGLQSTYGGAEGVHCDSV